MTTLYVRIGRRYREAASAEVCEVAAAYNLERATVERPILNSPRAAKDYLQHQAGLDYEQFGVLWLTARHKLIKAEVLFKGTIDGSSVHPREVVKAALANAAAEVILFHNHPSGVAEPSISDESISVRLRDALALIEVHVVDHLIIGANTMTSLAERGLL